MSFCLFSRSQEKSDNGHRHDKKQAKLVIARKEFQRALKRDKWAPAENDSARLEVTGSSDKIIASWLGNQSVPVLVVSLFSENESLQLLQRQLKL